MRKHRPGRCSATKPEIKERKQIVAGGPAILAWMACMGFWAVGQCAGQTLFQDNFNGSLNAAWSIIRPSSSFYSLTATGLVLRCNSGDLYQSDNNASNVFVISNPCPGDFNATAKLRWLTPPASAYAQFALLAYDDDDNYVRAYYGDTTSGLGFYNASETAAVYTGTGDTLTNMGTGDFWIQLQKRDYYFSMAFSLDGTNFTTVSPGSNFQDGLPAYLGLVAMVDPTQTATALVESFTVTSIPPPALAPGWVYQPISLTAVLNDTNTWLIGYPSGAITMNGVPFQLLPGTGENIWNSTVGTTLGVRSTQTMSLPVNLYGVAAVDALVNTGWGDPGSQEVALVFQFANGSSYTNTFTAGQDIRDWLQNVYVNTLTSTNSSQVFSSTATVYAGKWGRMDKQHVAIPAQFSTLTLTNILLIDSGVTGNNDASYSLSVHAQRSYLQGLTATVTAQAVLNIGTQPGISVLSWSTNGPAWVLQSSTNLLSDNWSNYATLPQSTNGLWTVIVSNRLSPPVQFFRLRAGN